MTMTYRTRRRLQTIGTIGAILLLVIIALWLCWVVWLERYVVYTRDNEAILDLEFNANEMIGEVARPPESGGTGISIYYNEGDNAVELTNELTQLNGYYIDGDMLMDDMTGVWDSLAILPSGTPVMVELKGGYGSFYYTSGLQDAIQSQSVNVTEVDLLIQELNNRGFYTIAKVSAFRDYNFGLNHVNHGLPVAGKQYLWSDDGGCYWMNPTATPPSAGSPPSSRSCRTRASRKWFWRTSVSPPVRSTPSTATKTRLWIRPPRSCSPPPQNPPSPCPSVWTAPPSPWRKAAAACIWKM